MIKSTGNILGGLVTVCAVIAIGACSPSNEPPQRIQHIMCATSPRGAVTTWLRYGPAPEVESESLLRELGPERLVLNYSSRWKPFATRQALSPISEEPLAQGRAVYLLAELVPANGGTRTLQALFTGRLRMWVDGELVCDQTERMLWSPGRQEVMVSFEDGVARILLVELSGTSDPVFGLYVLEGLGEGSNPTLAVRLPASSEEALAELLAQSFRLEAGNGGEVLAGEPVQISLSIPAGYPLLSEPLHAVAQFYDEADRQVGTVEMGPLPMRDVAVHGLSARWDTPTVRAPFYAVRVTLFSGPERLATLETRVGSRDGVRDWLHALREELKKALAAMGAKMYDSPAAAIAKLKLEKAQTFLDRAILWRTALDRTVKELLEARAALDRLRTGERPVEGNGLLEKAYISTVDDSAQPYVVYLPEQFLHKTRTEPLPLIVILHGYSPWLDKTNWMYFAPELRDLADRRGFILLMPFARSNTDFQSIGELDVLHTMELVRRKYFIDEDRIILYGYSMGGMGAYTLGVHYPDLWAGIVVLAGRADYYLWKRLERERVEPFKRHLIDMEFGHYLAENLSNVPVRIYHGKRDMLVEPEQAPRMASRLKALGADVTLIEYEDQDHWLESAVWADAGLEDWLVSRRRQRCPQRVDFTTYTTRYTRAWWVEIDGIERWTEPANVKAELLEPGHVRVHTQNVQAVNIHLSEEITGERHTLYVEWNGTVTTHPAAENRTVRLGGERRTEGRLTKTAAVMGPIKEAYNARFILVQGSGGTPAEKGILERRVQDAAREWREFAKGEPLVRLDTELTAADVQSANLVLFGTPATNCYLERIADRLPVEFDAHTARLRNSRMRYDLSNAGFAMIYPNPENPERYVVVRAGVAYGEFLPPNHKYDLMPDFVFYEPSADYDGTNRTLCAGFFDSHWELRSELTWARSDAGTMKWQPETRRGAVAERLPGANEPVLSFRLPFGESLSSDLPALTTVR